MFFYYLYYENNMNIPLIELPPLISGRFLERKNKFLILATIKRNWRNHLIDAHLHDPGRLQELLRPGVRLLLHKITKKKTRRKTNYDVLFVKYKEKWVLINTMYHRAITQAILTHPALNLIPSGSKIIPEYSIGNSRIDFLVDTPNGGKLFIEVKGCTLKKGMAALFPDAPTKRGRKHLIELKQLLSQGFKAMVIFLVFTPNVDCFRINEELDPALAEVFNEARNEGLDVVPIQLSFIDNWIHFEKVLPYCSS